jgi:integrase
MSGSIAALFQRLTQGVYVVGVARGETRDAFTAAWVMQVSYDPLLLALSVNTNHSSYRLLKEGRLFSVNVLKKGQCRMGIGRMIERAGEAAGLPFPVRVHMLRHSTGYALAARGMDTRRLQHFLGHASITNTVRYTAMSPEPFKDIWR